MRARENGAERIKIAQLKPCIKVGQKVLRLAHREVENTVIGLKLGWEREGGPSNQTKLVNKPVIS